MGRVRQYGCHAAGGGPKPGTARGGAHLQPRPGGVVSSTTELPLGDRHVVFAVSTQWRHGEVFMLSTCLFLEDGLRPVYGEAYEG